MNPSTRQRKVELRRVLKERIRQLSPIMRKSESEQICQRLRHQGIWRQAQAIMLFAPMNSEPNIWPLLEEAETLGKTLVLPRFVPGQKLYEACRIESLANDLSPGNLGILEPKASCPRFAANQLDFVLVPGLGFSFDGWRLGRGKGYYDRLLTPVRGLKCGVAFDWQMELDVPVEPHDIRLDCILTPTHWRVVAGAGRF